MENTNWKTDTISIFILLFILIILNNFKPFNAFPENCLKILMPFPSIHYIRPYVHHQPYHHRQRHQSSQRHHHYHRHRHHHYRHHRHHHYPRHRHHHYHHHRHIVIVVLILIIIFITIITVVIGVVVIIIIVVILNITIMHNIITFIFTRCLWTVTFPSLLFQVSRSALT